MKQSERARTDGGRPRNGAVDLLKVLAIFGVIIIHTAPGGYIEPIGSFDFCSAVFWGSLVRASVPVFLMCSGALLLNPQKPLTIKKLYTKNIFRIIVAMIFWGMIYKLYHLTGQGLSGFTPAAVFQALKEVLVFKNEFHFYYLYIILLVYAFLPVTRVFTAHAAKKELQYFLAVWFALGIVAPIAKFFWPFHLISGTPLQAIMNMYYSAIGYGILGYYIQAYPPKKAWPCALLFLAGFAGVFGVTVWRSIAEGKLYQLFFEGMSPCVAFMAAGLFGFVTARVKPETHVCRWVTHVSRASFCIYLVHIIFLWVFARFGLTVAVLPALISIPLISAAVYLCCEPVYLLLSHIPGLKKYLV